MTDSNNLADIRIDLSSPTLLFEQAGHAVYWLGIADETPFRCNAYLICDNDQAIITDPGSHGFFQQVADRVKQIMPTSQVIGMVLSHQDPDIAASMIDWLDLNPDMQVITSPRTNVLLPHYGNASYRYFNFVDQGDFTFASGNTLRFIESPFLHFPGAFTTYDTLSRYLFSSDIWAALEIDWTLTVEDFEDHIPKLNLFHMDYMASNLAARGFLRNIEGVEIDAICPQHGSIIPSEFVGDAIDYLKNLRCGTDIIYADLEDEE